MKAAYKSCRLGTNPLHWGVYVSDQDSASSVAVQEAREECGEGRKSDWQFCYHHLLKGSHRQLTKTLNLKDAHMMSASIPSEQSTNSLDPDKPFRCTRCVKSFKTVAGRTTHGRFCKGELPATTPSSQSWLTASGISPKEVKPFRKKILHWLLVRKNAELKRGVSFWKNLKSSTWIQYGAF